MTAFLAIGAGVAALSAGVVLLRAAAIGAANRRAACTLAGWSLVAAVFGVFTLTTRPELAFALMTLALSLVAYVVVAASVRIRGRRAGPARERHLAEDPGVRPRRPWRLGLRLLLAGPLSFIFSVAACLALATRTPVAEIDAVMLGGLFAPVAFAAAVAWSLADARLWRVSAGLSGASLVMFGLAAWRI